MKVEAFIQAIQLDNEKSKLINENKALSKENAVHSLQVIVSGISIRLNKSQSESIFSIVHKANHENIVEIQKSFDEL